MQLLTVVVAHADSVAAQQLSNSLRAHFRRVAVANDKPGLRDAIEHHRAHLAIVDLDIVPLDEVKELCEEYSATGVVCVHRAPDYELWNAAMSAGALECCHPTDLPSILNAMRARPMAKGRAAAA
jgi:AmiR/NasT family two-component response regulator